MRGRGLFLHAYGFTGTAKAITAYVHLKSVLGEGARETDRLDLQYHCPHVGLWDQEQPENVWEKGSIPPLAWSRGLLDHVGG